MSNVIDIRNGKPERKRTEDTALYKLVDMAHEYLPEEEFNRFNELLQGAQKEMYKNLEEEFMKGLNK